MAIFGDKDAGLPITVQLYQLKIIGTEKMLEGELRKWFLRRWGTTLEAIDAQQERQLYALAILQPLVKTIFDYMANEGMPSQSQYAQFAEAIDALNRRAASMVPTLFLTSYSTTNMEYPVKMSYRGKDADLEVMAITELFDALPKGRSVFMKCPTCESVFISTRADHVRCSRRCNDREVNRRRHSKRNKANIATQ